jgi:hypothetical protein
VGPCSYNEFFLCEAIKNAAINTNALVFGLMEERVGLFRGTVFDVLGYSI